jgi:predicted nucleic acid-binding protein
MYTLDTNAIVYYLEGETGAVAWIERQERSGINLFVPTIVELELLSLPTLTRQEMQDIDEFLATAKIVPLHSDIARIAADLRRRYKILTPDSAIAATALFTGSALVTRNVKHFGGIKELKAQTI